MSTIQQSKISVWNKRVNLNFQIRGHGPALIYFHPAAGLGWDPFLEKLAQSYTIYAPEFRALLWAIPMQFTKSTISPMRYSSMRKRSVA